MRRILFLCLLAALLAAPAAKAASTNQILRDCEDDSVLEGHYTVAEMRKALHNLPTDVSEYSDCNDVLTRAINAATADSSGPAAPSSPAPSGGGSGNRSTTAVKPQTGAPAHHGSIDTPLDGANTVQERNDAGNAIVASRGQPVDVGGKRISPGRLVAALMPPTTLSVVLALLAATALAAAAPYLRRVIAPRRRHPS
jgi:hypothetical protein